MHYEFHYGRYPFYGESVAVYNSVSQHTISSTFYPTSSYPSRLSLFSTLVRQFRLLYHPHSPHSFSGASSQPSHLITTFIYLSSCTVDISQVLLISLFSSLLSSPLYGFFRSSALCSSTKQQFKIQPIYTYMIDLP